MFATVPAGSTLTLVLLAICLLLVIAYEVSNGFHDAANAVATVIYTHSLKPTIAVLWSGIMNFTGVLVGGIAVAYAPVEILPPEVLSPPNGDPAVGMLTALFPVRPDLERRYLGARHPNSSSHALIGLLIGISISAVIKRAGCRDGRGTRATHVGRVRRGSRAQRQDRTVVMVGRYDIRHRHRAHRRTDPRHAQRQDRQLRPRRISCAGERRCAAAGGPFPVGARHPRQPDPRQGH